MFEPSSKTELSAAQLLQRKRKGKKRRLPRQVMYEPLIDGVNGAAPAEDHDELAEYSVDLDRLALPVPEDQPDGDDLLPDQEMIDSLPW